MRLSLPLVTLTLVAAATLLIPTAAQARGPRPHDAEVRVVTAPPPAPRAGGTWERQISEVWIPARHERVWVEKTCYERRGRRHSTRAYSCGHHVTRTQPGYMEQRETWVWVPHPVVRPRVSVRLPTPVGLDIRLSL